MRDLFILYLEERIYAKSKSYRMHYKSKSERMHLKSIIHHISYKAECLLLQVGGFIPIHTH